jgi:hypothetical protein
MNPLLIKRIKDILESNPLDVYNEEDEMEGTIELVSSRSDYGDRYIGTANIFMAVTIFIYASLGYTKIVELPEEVLDQKMDEWHGILNTLKEEKFIRDTQPLVKEKIKLVVDNTKAI